MPEWSEPPDESRAPSHGAAKPDPSGRVDCFRCRHLTITHQPDWPYACERFGLRSRQLPSLVVLRESGAPCRGFEAKPNRR